MLPPSALRKARFVDDAPDDAFWRTLHRLADEAYPAMRDALVEAFASTGATLSAEALASLLTANDQAALLALIRTVWDEAGVPGLQRALVEPMREVALRAAAATAIPEVTVAVAFNQADPVMLAALEAYGAQQVTAISETTREALRGILQRSAESGQGLSAQIAEIRQMIGLTPRQAASVAWYREGLIEAGMKPARVEQLVARRTARLVRERAETIARTETINAAARGQQARWEQAAQDGLWDHTRLRRYWVVTPDERNPPPDPCPAIPGLNPDGVGLTEPFQTPVGLIHHPTVHPR